MTGSRAPALRLGVAVDSITCPEHLGMFLDALQRQRLVHLDVLILHQRTRQARPAASAACQSFVSQLCAHLASAILFLERTILRVLAAHWAPVARRAGKVRPSGLDIRQRFDHVLEIAPGSTAAGLPPLDLLLVFGRSPLTAWGVALEATEILQIELGTAPAHSLPIAGFAEVFSGLDETPVNLSRFAAKGSQRQILVEGRNRTKPLFYLNQAALWNRATSLLLSHLHSETAVRTATGAARDEPPPPWSHATSSPAIHTAACLLAYPLRVSWRMARLAIRQLRGKRQWSIAIHRRSESGHVLGESLSVPQPPDGTYHADPMLYRCPISGKNYCFVEEYDSAVRRGHIAVLEQGLEGWSRSGIAIKESYHLSFPFVFDYEGALYMCPETAESGNIVVYRCVELPLRWQPCAQLMTGVSATDSMLFAHHDRWWMLTNLDRAENPDHQSELHLYHAESPLSVDWTPVRGNPVKVSPSGARNGGLMVTGGRLFRFGQVQSFDGYGRALIQYEIVRIDADGYQEEFVQRITPPAGSGSTGIHTFSSVRDLVAVDLRGAVTGGRLKAIPAAPVPA